MGNIEHWLATGQGDNDATFIVWGPATAEHYRALGYRVDGPFVDPATYRGAVEALREIKAQLARIESPADREDGAARALVMACDALDQLGGR